MKIIGIIPARYASTRFPGKPLTVIQGKTMITRVAEQASKAKRLSKVVVATDDERIANEVKANGFEVVMTGAFHKSGTDRCAEVVNVLKEKFDAVINIQGDEPFIHPEQIDLLCSLFEDSSVEIGTLVKKLSDASDLDNPNVMKVALDIHSNALYFSRSPIPFVRGAEKNHWLDHFNFQKHIGIYGYRTEILKKITALPQGKLEIAESLEQLRWLENGHQIRTAFTELESISIDTPEDLLKLK
ncbi:MAG TPA: 3-deoxy-manno-octulosonate cytidylyltransferase [Bacteroidia bacterium]|jgi:3-deoxy-manno-octulosonate cytidylyltransferase (CMP-KDO synthetase)|nr:3-deoxy-manno-octulosonate cytidylyltransferase [Bacteroidia bacterium]